MTDQPDPNCRWYKGTGKIPLFTSSCDCDCVNPQKQDINFTKSLEIPSSPMSEKIHGCRKQWYQKYGEEVTKNDRHTARDNIG